jgi:hypothetical protein
MQYMTVYSTGENYYPGDVYAVIKENIGKLEMNYDCAFCQIRNAYFSMVLVVVDSPLPVDDSLEICKKLMEFYNGLHFSEKTPSYGDGAYFGKGVNVDNLKQRILSWPNEHFEIIHGPIIKRIKSQGFMGESVEAAKAAAIKAIHTDGKISFEVIQEPSAGFMGIGKKPAKINARFYEVEIAQE